MQYLSENDSVHRGHFARLQYHGAPSRECGSDLARDLVDRPVPRRNQPAYTDRFATKEVLAFLLFPLEVFQNLERRGEVGLARRRLSCFGQPNWRTHFR